MDFLETKIEWIKLDSDDYETIIRTTLEEIAKIVDKSFNILEAAKKREFDILEYWEKIKGNPPKSLNAKKRTSNAKKSSLSCKLNVIERIKLIDKLSSKLQTNDLLRSKRRVSLRSVFFVWVFKR